MHLNIRNLTKQTGIYGFFQILQRVISFAVIPLYTHYLSPEQFGSLDILYLIVWFIGIVGGSKLDAAFIRYYTPARAENRVDSLVSSSVIGLAAFATFFCGMAALCAGPILRFMYSSQEVPFTAFYVALTATWLELVGSLPLSYLRINQQARLVGTLGFAKAILGAAVGVAGVIWFKLGVTGILLGAACGSALSAAVAFSLMLRRERITFDTGYAGLLYRYALPMLPAPIFMYALNYADRFFLAKYWSLAEVGVYGLAYKFAMLANLAVMAPFGEMWGSNQFTLYEAGQKDTYRRIALLYVSLLYFVSLGIAFFSYEVTLVAFDHAYHALIPMVAPLTIAVAIWGIVPTLDFGCQIKNKTWVRSFTTGAAALLNIALNFVLISRYGAMGAAIATLLSFIALTCVTHLLNRMLTDYCVDVRKATLLSGALAALACISYTGAFLPYYVFVAARAAGLIAFAWLLLRVNGIRPLDLLRMVGNRGLKNA